MPKNTSKRDLRGSELTEAIAEKIFGWRNVHKHDGELKGKKQDKLGRWRLARVPDYANDPNEASAIDERMKQLGRGELYDKELARITKAAGLPTGWATPEQRSRAAVKVVNIKRMK